MRSQRCRQRWAAAAAARRDVRPRRARRMRPATEAIAEALRCRGARHSAAAPRAPPPRASRRACQGTAPAGHRDRRGGSPPASRSGATDADRAPMRRARRSACCFACESGGPRRRRSALRWAAPDRGSATRGLRCAARPPRVPPRAAIARARWPAPARARRHSPPPRPTRARSCRCPRHRPPARRRVPATLAGSHPRSGAAARGA